jgi:hypothetical protein
MKGAVAVLDRRWRVTPSRHSLPPAARGSPGRAELRAGREGSTRRWAASRRRPRAMAPKRGPVCAAAPRAVWRECAGSDEPASVCAMSVRRPHHRVARSLLAPACELHGAFDDLHGRGGRSSYVATLRCLSGTTTGWVSSCSRGVLGLRSTPGRGPTSGLPRCFKSSQAVPVQPAGDEIVRPGAGTSNGDLPEAGMIFRLREESFPGGSWALRDRQ